jgi:multimeric flavodoxin WrbA
MILGISASGRRPKRNKSGTLLCGTTEEILQYLLERTDEPYEYVSLSGKMISGCMGCVRCASDNICVLEDDWAEIRDKMFIADAIVFGAPNYYGSINALGHAFLERTFSLRHREVFPLSGKLNAIVASGSPESGPVEEFIRKIFRSNHMAEPTGVVNVPGISQCYQCGYGEQCSAGSVVNRHGFLDEIKEYHLPDLPPETYRRADIVSHKLGNMVRAKKQA